MKASEIASRDSYLVSGPGAVGDAGEQVVWVRLQPRHLAGPGRLRRRQAVRGGGTGAGRRRDRSASVHRLVATRYSQVRIDARPSKPGSACQADSKVSCSASSASVADPSSR